MGSSNLEEMDERLQRIEGIAQQLLRVSNELLESNLEMSNALTALAARINLREALPPTPSDEYLNFQEIARRAGVTPAAVTNWRIRHDDFPRPIKEIGKTKLFSARQVNAWLASREARQPKAVTEMQHS